MKFDTCDSAKDIKTDLKFVYGYIFIKYTVKINIYRMGLSE